MKRLYSILIFFIVTQLAVAAPPSQIDTKKPLPKVIRTCCAFGVDVKVVMLPFAKINSVTAPNLIGTHHFLGNKLENNGIIYTKHGGFIDLGHLRDIADLTSYLFVLLQENKSNGMIAHKLGREAGLKTLDINVPKNINDTDLALLAGKIAYDLSTWHEISTWFGASSVPFVAERYSSFSVEDAYSNLMGVYLSINSILAPGKFEEEMTKNINLMLNRLDAVPTIEDTRNAMLEVKNIWWSGNAKFPNKNLMIVRQYDILDKVSPMNISDIIPDPQYDLDVPKTTQGGIALDNFYQLKIKYNLKIPAKKIFGSDFKDHWITQNDFATLIGYAETGKF